MTFRYKQVRGKRAVSSIVGGIFVLAIMVLGITSIVFVSGLENNVHQGANSVAKIDTARNQEKLNVQSVLFGGSQTYAPSQSYVTSGSCSSTCGVEMATGSSFTYDSTRWCYLASTCGTSNYTLKALKPAYVPFNVTSATTTGYEEGISNMNFSTSAAGWTVYTTSSQVIGGFAATQGNGVPGSGVGAMYIGASFISGSTVTGNESTRFYVDPTNTGVGTITTAGFSYAHYISQNALSNAKVNSLTYSIYLVDQTGGTANGKNYLITSLNYPNYQSGDTAWVYLRGITTLANGTSIAAALNVDKGFYSIVIVTSITFQGGSCNSACTQFFGYYDDVGLVYGYNSFVTDWSYTFHVGQTPSSIKNLAFTVTTFYNQSNVLQYVYLYDFVLDSWDLFSTSTVSTQPSTVSISINVTNTGQFSAQNLVSSGGLVMLRVYSVRSSALSTGALGDNMETDVASIGGGLSITISFTSQNAFTVVLQNGGPQPLEVVSLVILDSNGHTYINSTGTVYYNGTFSTALTYDQVIYPLQTVSTQVSYTWQAGSITLVFLTARGNVFIVPTTAST